MNLENKLQNLSPYEKTILKEFLEMSFLGSKAGLFELKNEIDKVISELSAREYPLSDIKELTNLNALLSNVITKNFSEIRKTRFAPCKVKPGFFFRYE